MLTLLAVSLSFMKGEDLEEIAAAGLKRAMEEEYDPKTYMQVGLCVVCGCFGAELPHVNVLCVQLNGCHAEACIP